MTHRLLQTVAGADDYRAGDATELKEELVEDRVCCVVSFPDDQYWSPVGTTGDLAFGVIFFSFGFDCSRSMCIFLMMYDLFKYCVKWRL